MLLAEFNLFLLSPSLKNWIYIFNCWPKRKTERFFWGATFRNDSDTTWKTFYLSFLVYLLLLRCSGVVYASCGQDDKCWLMMFGDAGRITHSSTRTHKTKLFSTFRIPPNSVTYRMSHGLFYKLHCWKNNCSVCIYYEQFEIKGSNQLFAISLKFLQACLFIFFFYGRFIILSEQ